MKDSKTTSPTFEIAQELSKNYNTIESKYILTKNLQKYFNQNDLEKYKDFGIKEIYNKILLQYYPNETSIKSQFINKILINGKNHVTIFELPILKSRADLCKINGKSIAYEIKTDLDNFNRLEKQLNDYFQIFDEVFVICSTKKVKEISNLIPEKTGIFSYRITKNKKYIFKKEKDSQENLNLNKKAQLNVLSNKELSNLIQFSNNKSREDIINEICYSKSNEEINKFFKKSLKIKYSKNWDFIKKNKEKILDIDYQWFFKNQIDPSIIYQFE
ncbi:MAG: sce7726 family protein [Pleomorphochaeta sp.]